MHSCLSAMCVCVFVCVAVCLPVCLSIYFLSVWNTVPQTWCLREQQKTQIKMKNQWKRYERGRQNISKIMPPSPNKPSQNDAMNVSLLLVLFGHANVFLWGVFGWMFCCDCLGEFFSVIFICFCFCGLSGVEHPKNVRFDLRNLGGVLLNLKHSQSRGSRAKCSITPSFEVLARATFFYVENDWEPNDL